MLDDFLTECGGVSYKTLEKHADEPLPALTVPQHLLTSGPVSKAAPPKIATNGAARVEYYLGPDLEVTPESLDKYEAQGGWIIEPKHDGMWAMLTVGDPANGEPHTLKSRAAGTGFVGGANAGDLVLCELPLPKGCVLVGELEAATEASTKFFESFGHRRLHLFDFPYGTADYRKLIWSDRRKLLETAHGAFDEHALSRFPITPFFTDHFRKRYEAWIEAGLEGCVIKRVTSTYTTHVATGKTEHWHRCKKRVTADYVLCGLAKTPGGQPTGAWGLYKGGKLKRVVQARCPEKLLVPENVGKLVCEFMGWEVHSSGALRHAQWVRVRDDKTPAMCVHSDG